MDIIKSEQLTILERFQQRVLLRDKLKKEAISIQAQYNQTFGDLILEAFQLKIDCIRLKKQISFCQMYVNQNKAILESNLQAYIERVMVEYNQELEALSSQINSSKSAGMISQKDFIEIKRIYRKIAKAIHPDLHPELFKRKEIKNLWNRTMVAYRCNHLEELKEIELLVDALTLDASDIQMENIDQRLEKINEEIKEIMNSDPYQYKYILDDRNEVKDRKEEYQREIKEYQRYKKELEDIFQQFDIQTMMN